MSTITPTAGDAPPVDPLTPDPEQIAGLLARPVLSLADLQAVSGLGLSTLRRAIDRGDLPARKIGRRVLIPTPAALAWLAGDGAA